MRISFQGINDISAKSNHYKNGDLISAEAKFRLDNRGENHLDKFKDSYIKAFKKPFIGDEVRFRVESEDDLSLVLKDNLHQKNSFYINNKLVRKNLSTRPFFTKMTMLLEEICEDTSFSSFANQPQKTLYLEKRSYDPATNILKKLSAVETIRIIKEKSLLGMVESLLTKLKKSNAKILIK